MCACVCEHVIPAWSLSVTLASLGRALSPPINQAASICLISPMHTHTHTRRHSRAPRQSNQNTFSPIPTTVAATRWQCRRTHELADEGRRGGGKG